MTQEYIDGLISASVKWEGLAGIQNTKGNVLRKAVVLANEVTHLSLKIVKDLNIIVSDDKSNIENLVECMKWDNKLTENLIKDNGLRNIIVHQYNGIQKEIISKTIFILQTNLYDWIQHIEEVIVEIENN